ncbi:hypothetical protein ACFQ2E_15635 [Hwangdonia seohaensis]|uniref:Uncharacterized protein n=1 Tax=Hwangdonia seohaensis TaxID=1240727 RepID=A0ABW3RFN3_9FLAO
MKDLINSSKAIAIISFAIGTILFVLQLYFRKSVVFIYPGIIFILIAVIINSILLIALVFSLIGYINQRLELLKTCGLVLLNIPIAILYFYILIETL